MISDIPTLTLSSKDQARRFISLIDALYESRCQIICHAEVQPDQLFFPETDSAGNEGDILHAESVGGTQERYRPNVSTYTSLHPAEMPVEAIPLALDKLSIFSGECHVSITHFRHECQNDRSR